MKQLLFILLLMTIIVECFSQQVSNTIDVAKLEVAYAQDYIIDTVAKKYCHEKFVLQIGSKVNKFYSLYAEYADSIMKAEKARNTNKTDGAINVFKWFQPNESIRILDVYSNYPNNGYLTFIRRFGGKQYCSQEFAPVVMWEIGTVTKPILGYQCIQAFTTLWGRKWTAWFTTEIPYNYGPYKFGGLPGLIMQISDDKSYITFEAIGMSQKRSPIVKSNFVCANVNRKQILMLETLTYSDPVSLYLQNNGKGKVFVKNSAGEYEEAKGGERRYPYIPPIELE